MHCHDASHHLRVWELAESVADNYPVDKEVLIAACLLHDISAQRAELDHTKSQQNDARIAEEVLIKVNFPVGKIPLVVDAILNHSSNPEFKERRRSMEAKILCDADKMDCLGAMGVTRIFSALITRGKSIKEIVELYHGKKIKQKYEAISLSEFKDRAEKEYLYTQEFFQKLARELKLL